MADNSHSTEEIMVDLFKEANLIMMSSVHHNNTSVEKKGEQAEEVVAVNNHVSRGSSKEPPDLKLVMMSGFSNNGGYYVFSGISTCGGIDGKIGGGRGVEGDGRCEGGGDDVCVVSTNDAEKVLPSFTPEPDASRKEGGPLAVTEFGVSPSGIEFPGPPAAENRNWKGEENVIEGRTRLELQKYNLFFNLMGQAQAIQKVNMGADKEVVWHATDASMGNGPKLIPKQPIGLPEALIQRRDIRGITTKWCVGAKLLEKSHTMCQIEQAAEANDNKLEHIQFLISKDEEAWRDANRHGGEQTMFVGVQTPKLHKIFSEFEQRMCCVGYYWYFNPENALLENLYFPVKAYCFSFHLIIHDPLGSSTLPLEFPKMPLWLNVYVQNQAEALVPLYGGGVEDDGLFPLGFGAVLSFRLVHFGSLKFQLMTEELLMSYSVIKIIGALQMSIKRYQMLNSKIFIDSNGVTLFVTSSLDASKLVALKDSSVIDSKANSEVHGQGFWPLSVPGNLIEVQHLILSLLCNACAKPEPALQGFLEATNEDILCRVEGNIIGSAVHLHWIRKVDVQSVRFGVQIDATGHMSSSLLSLLVFDVDIEENQPKIQWDPGGSSNISLVISVSWSSCFKLWDPGRNLFSAPTSFIGSALLLQLTTHLKNPQPLDISNSSLEDKAEVKQAALIGPICERRG